MSADFPYDVFLSHSSEDKAVARPLADQLRADGLKVPFHFGFRISDFGFRICAARPVGPGVRVGLGATGGRPCGRGNRPFRDPLNLGAASFPHFSLQHSSFSLVLTPPSKAPGAIPLHQLAPGGPRAGRAESPKENSPGQAK